MGESDALLELGRCYESGRGVPLDRDPAMGSYVQLLESSLTTEASPEAAEARLTHLRVQISAETGQNGAVRFY